MTLVQWERAIVVMRRAGLGGVRIFARRDYRIASLELDVAPSEAPRMASVLCHVALEAGAVLRADHVRRDGVPVLWMRVVAHMDDMADCDDLGALESVDDEVDPGRGIPRVPGDRF